MTTGNPHIGDREILKHANADYLVCLIRRKLIKVQPEELLRQSLLKHLMNDLDYPSGMMDVEVPMSYFKKNAKGRADIVIYNDYIASADEVLMVIECKAEGVDIRDYRFERQLNRYSTITDAQFAVLTNGTEFEATEVSSGRKLENIPTFSDYLEANNLEYRKEEQFVWHNHSEADFFDNDVWQSFIDGDIISEVTPAKFYPPIIRLIDLFYNQDKPFSNLDGFGLTLVRDYGLRFTNYGFAFGDGLKGFYRYLMFKQPDGNHIVISFSIYHQTDWGTYLMVAVDERQGHSLELRLDNYLSKDGEKLWRVWHNGSLTVGRKGRLKNSVVLEYIKTNCPELVKNSIVELGEFRTDEDLINSEDVSQLILRIAKYASLREEIRKLYS
ncbi:MAG: type I restriction enzyme HsdR N-terminal domain-containing protein [Flavobacteriales bacterium]|jgi:hypothetical protein|nr:type I restriction enzyme HsdR N-terminal domain-containing protein [Flavobacteriales bacterium]